MPTMAGAFAYDLYKNWSLLSVDDAATIGIGFVMAFLPLGPRGGALAPRLRLPYGFAPFAWWRIAVGAIGIGVILAYR